MNLDDYILSDSISTPTGIATSPSPELTKKEIDRSSNSIASAIPIKMRKESTQQFSVPQSVPVPHHAPRSNEEFNYVQRHVRKTSIDERRVSFFTSCGSKFKSHLKRHQGWRLIKLTGPQTTGRFFAASQQHNDSK